MKIFFMIMILTIAGSITADASWEQQIVRRHPRLFVNKETLPVLIDHTRGVARPYYERLKAWIDALPDKPVLKLNEELFELSSDGTAKFRGRASQGRHLVELQGGREAFGCALIYLVAGEEKYKVKAYEYMRLALDFYLWCHRHRILSDWYFYDRIYAMVAYDWIYNDLTETQRREFIVPMIRYIDELQDRERFPYFRSRGGSNTGNYGDMGLTWFAGLVAYADGHDDKTAEKLLRTGYRIYRDMMIHRERASRGSGLLASASPGYSFGEYPCASFFFLLTWQSSTGEDISPRWRQMCDYPKWFAWSAIPAGDGAFYHYGIGDTQHFTNRFPRSWLESVYRSMARTIHVFGRQYPESAVMARAVISMLPEEVRNLGDGIWPFILFNYDPDVKNEESPEKVLAQENATYIPSFGLAFMRSGFGTDDTYCLFRAGSRNPNHQHYDENHFTIFKHDFLALDSGTRTQTMHHCYYAPQSVAHNTILIHMENEPLAPFWKPWGPGAEKDTYNLPGHGGQYKLTGARCTAFTTGDNYTYVANDATGTYREEKCREAVRQFVYVRPDHFVVFDRVESVKPEQTKEFLLHTQNEPVSFPGNIFRAEHGGGRLFVQSFLPENAIVEKVGGPGRQFMASGRNWPLPGGEQVFQRPNKLGQWRLEVKDAQPVARTRFLHLLQVSDTSVREMVPAKLIMNEQTAGVEFADFEGRKWQVEFNLTGSVGGRVRIWDGDRLMVDEELKNNR